MPGGVDIGDKVTLTFEVRVAGVLTNATTKTIVVTKPDGTTLSPAPTITSPSTGLYSADVYPDAAGEWLYRWAAFDAGGLAMAARDDFFMVEVALTSTYYISVDELREELADSTSKLNNNLLEKAVRVGSRAVDKYTKRRFWRNATASAQSFYVLDFWEPRLVYVPDIATQTGLIVKTDDSGTGSYGTTWSSSNYALGPLNADRDGGAYSWTEVQAINRDFPAVADPGIWGRSGKPAPVQVTAVWGWSQVPEQVREATLLKAVRYYRRKDSPDGVIGSNEWGLVRITRQDPDIIELLDKLVKRAR